MPNQEPTTKEKLDYLLNETQDLQARVVALAAVVGALLATHPDKAAAHEYLMKMRGGLPKNPPEPLQTQEQIDTALATIDWLDRDLPSA